MGEEHPPHPKVALTEDQAGALHGHLSNQGHGKGLKLLGEMLAAPLPMQSKSLHLAVVAKPSARHGRGRNFGSSPSAFLRPQLGGLLYP